MEDLNAPQILAMITFCGAIIGVYVRLNNLIDKKITKYDVEEEKTRKLRKEKYELEFNTLNKKADGTEDKVISIGVEIQGDGGIKDKIKDLEFEIERIKGV